MRERLRRRLTEDFGVGAVAPSPAGTPARDQMHALIALQRADGSWDLTGELAQAVGCSPGELESAAPAPLHGDARRAWATAVALEWLRTRASGEEDLWRLLAAKAGRWLAHASSTSERGIAWIDGARAFLHSWSRAV
jgi:hypothetical protein